MLKAAVILILTYIGVASTRLPGVNVDRSSAAFTGAILMVLAGVLTFGEAVGAIDFNTIALLLGMMILVSSLKVVGFFDLLAIKSLSLARTPWRLLVLVIVATAVASAFFVNDAVVLLFTPIVIKACRARKVNPIPYLIAEAMASNIGSTATVVGNPQNMLIGVTSGISFTRFFSYLFPVALVGTLALILIMYLFYRKTFREGFHGMSTAEFEGHGYDTGAIKRLVPILFLVMVAFFLSSFFHLSVPVIALAAAAVVLIVGKAKPTTVIKEVDWVLLLFFAGLFVVIGAAHNAGLFDVFINRITITPDLKGIASICAASTLISQIVSNVPLTMLLLPILKNVPGDVLWIALAAGATLGGNLTIIGAVANLIVVEGAAKGGVRVRFWEFLKVGLVVTVVTVGLAILILGAEYWGGWLR